MAATVQNVDLGQITVIDGGQGRVMAGAALGRARMLSESLATLESMLGVDLRQLSQNIAGNVAGKAGGDAVAEPPKAPSTPSTPRRQA